MEKVRVAAPRIDCRDLGHIAEGASPSPDAWLPIRTRIGGTGHDEMEHVMMSETEAPAPARRPPILGAPVAAVVALALVAVMMASPAAAHATGVERMENAGWTCIDFAPLGIHCFNEPSSAAFGVEGWPTSVQSRVFTVDDQGHETYQGTEVWIRADVFERNPKGVRPCPQEGAHWEDLSGFELPYYGCHHFDMHG